MQRKSILAILGVMLAVVVTSLALVFTVGPKVSAVDDEMPPLVLEDEDDFVIDSDGVCWGFSNNVHSKLGIAGFYVGSSYVSSYPYDFIEIHVKFPDKVKKIKGYDIFNVVPDDYRDNGYYCYDNFSDYVTKIVLPSGLEEIDRYAFSGRSIRKIYCEVKKNEKPSGWDNEWCNGAGYNDENYEWHDAEIIWNCYRTVTFEENGGSSIADQKLLVDNDGIEAPTITKAHHQLVGWYSDEQLTQPFDFNTPIDNNLTLYAKWEIDKCTVNFLNYKGNHVPNQQIDYGSCAVEPTPTCEGYTFLGWYNLANDQKFDFNTPITYDMQLYAKWRDNSKPEEDPTQPENNETPSTTVENKNNGVIGWVIGLVLVGVGAAGTVAGVVVTKKRRK